MSDQVRGLVITFFGVLFVVPDSLFVRLIDAEALTIAFWRLFLVGLGTSIWLLTREGTAPFRGVLRTGHLGLIYMIGVGASGLLFILAVSLTSVANVVFIIASLPVFAAIFSRIFLAEPFSVRTLMTIAAVVPGLAIIAYGSGETKNASLVGDILAFGVSALYAAALTAARQARATSMVPGMAMGCLLAGLFIAPFAAPLSVPTSEVPLVAAHAGFILFSSVLLAIGPRYIPSAEVGLLVLLESVLAPVLAWVVVGENPGPYAVLGGGIVIGALFVSNLLLLRRQL
ncbi:MAG: DMT family transporter [Sulfitobacter sp.]|nr:DMT family transporter [Sulfitobacter sp.]